jgi:monoamine oxidase
MTEVLIFGAGAAGLAAACDLVGAGIKVTIIEARDRIGGRVYTHHDSRLSVPVELGAEFVHGKHPALMKILEDTAAPFVDVSDRHWFAENGKLSSSHEFWNRLTALMDLMDLKQPDRSFKTFLDVLPDDEQSRRARAAASLYVQGFHAARLERIGVHGLVKANAAEDEIDGSHSFRIVGGYDLVMKTLQGEAVAAGAAFYINTAVTEIRWRQDQVEAICTTIDGEKTFTASRAVITLPLAVLQVQSPMSKVQGPVSGTVRFVPELPADKRRAVEAIPVGQVVRVVMKFRSRFWEELQSGAGDRQDFEQLGFIHDPKATIPTWWTLLPIRAPILVGWTGGSPAEELIARTQESVNPTRSRETASAYREAILGHALNSLQQIFGVTESRLRDQLVACYTHDWQADPFARGAYAYLPINGLELQRTLALPVNDTLFFAGEATSVGYIGTVHGALDSGHRAAQEILRN